MCSAAATVTTAATASATAFAAATAAASVVAAATSTVRVPTFVFLLFIKQNANKHQTT